MSLWFRRAIGGVVLMICAANLFAGGSGLNVVVVANQNSSNSLQLANYYCEQRAVPSQNVLRINWTGNSIVWTKAEFESLLRAPLNAMLAARQLSNQVDYVLLSMDIPYRVTNSAGSIDNNVNGTTAALYYGFKNNPADPMQFCSLANGSASAYPGSEGIFRQTPPISATSNSWLVMMLTASNLTLAKTVVDKGLASDASFPTAPVYLMKNTDPARNVRYLTFDDAVFDARLRNAALVVRTNFDYLNTSPAYLGYQLGSQFGLVNIGFPATNTFAPGALADILTSYSGTLFERNIYGHTTALDYLNSGATASYGTVIEPCNYLEKFASPRNYFYQARGFSAAECYYQSVTNPYLGILVGEPLAAPFAMPASGAWSNPPSGTLLGGTTNLSVQFIAADASRPVQQVDLFVDGVFSRTLTNLPPRQNNILYVTLPGKTNLSYAVPANASLATVASGLAGVLNSPLNNTFTKVDAYVHGDRIEFRSTDPNRSGNQTPLSVSNAVGVASALTTFVRSGRGTFLDSPAQGIRGVSIAGTVIPGDVLQLMATKTNGENVTVSVTNLDAGATLSQFVQVFLDAINATSSLQGADGLVAEDLTAGVSSSMDFHLLARSPGLDAAQLQTLVTGTFGIAPVGTQRLDENLQDLQPRNHLYITAGLANLAFTFGFNTTTEADGFHELTAVAYEGSHVRTQKRISQNVRIQNTPLAASFTCQFSGTNAALEAMLQFTVTANTNTISRIELFSTGGSWGVVSNQPTATFSVAGTNLGAGLHPFYSIVTRADGKQYRTETKWLRLLDTEPPFSLTIAGSGPALSWPATSGRRYEVLSATNGADAFLVRDAVVPTNSPGQWSETNNTAPARSYRVRSVQ